MKTYYVYILLCCDKSFYTGVTNNVEKRVWEHQKGLIRGCYTHGRRPVRLVCCENFKRIEWAIAREKQIKGWSRDKNKALIAKNYEMLPDLSKSRT